ncbi:MAG: hypothetical protein AB7O62_04160 [Pirellulales bacterium]
MSEQVRLPVANLPCESAPDSPTKHGASTVRATILYDAASVGWLARCWRGSGPYWLALAFPWSMWLANWTEEPGLADVAVTIGGSLLWACLVSLLARLVVQDPVRRPVMASLLVLACLGYGHIYALLNPHGVWHRYLLPCWLAATLFSVAAIGKLRPNRAEWLSRWLRNAALLAMLLPLWHVAPLWWNGTTGATRNTLPLAAGAEQPANQPDVYYLILDGYARGDVLQQMHGFNNGTFLTALRERGFFVADQAQANYAQTRLSLPASLDMDYLPNLPADDAYEPHHTRLRAMRKQGQVLARFRQAGYRYRHVGSAHYRRSPDADEEFYLGRGDGSYRAAFLATTLWGPILDKLGTAALHNPADVHDYQLAAIASPKSAAAPLFTFAHICCPHPPYVYGLNGRLPQPIANDDANSRLYVEQIGYLNQQVLELIDAIDRTSGGSSVIVLQADHGSAMLGMARQPSAEQLTERMSIFSAYRLPASASARPYPSITPVNSFRVIFNGLFHDNWPLLPDKSFYSTYDRPFDFTRVP